jgi:hypothetical protein
MIHSTFYIRKWLVVANMLTDNYPPLNECLRYFERWEQEG